MKPDIRPEHSYPQLDINKAARFLLPGASTLHTRQPSVNPIPVVSSPATPASYSPQVFVPPAPQVVVKKEYTTSRAPFGPQVCYFCGNSGHSMKFCPEANTYIQAGRLIRVDGRLSIPDNNGIPRYPGTSTLKESVDAFYKEAREK
jgi:hypothetical protein